MEKKGLPPPYPGPALGYPEFHAVDNAQMAAFSPQPVLQAGPVVIDPVFQQPVSIVQPAPPTSIIQPAPQPAVTVIQQAPPPTIIQPAAQPAVTIIQPAAQPAVAVVSPTVIQPRLRETPGQLKCIYCQHEIVTVTRYINGALVWTIFGGLCITGFWPFCLIPFCVNACKDVEHSCPQCHNIISVYRRM
ncbi:lipopolysaccharide-induced tumor necrosis factor-alpha factor homolog isoform X1 [Pygocentrus nattereri]|uniref:LITAF domain-containing protein n=1 Tax=Pygocentrus nattereri TaxID=42514 RepID=A0A3B4C3Y5_PYGNA|nr:lipopolysaccharide-induced tumor necrosis factor-alpha factor homolog isoform X1 [Pygocentrus nattereri]